MSGTASIESLEARTLRSADPSVDTLVIVGTTGSDQINVTVSEYTSGRVVNWWVNGHHQQRSSPFFEHVKIVDPSGNDRYTLESGPVGVDFQVLDVTGDDHCQVYGHVKGRVLFSAGAGSDRLSFGQNSAGASGRTLRFDHGRVEFGPHNWIQTQSVEAFSLKGTAQADTFDIGYLRGDQKLALFGEAGNDTFRLGRGDLDSNLYGQVTLFGGTGHDRVSFDDSADIGSDRYVLGRSALSKPGMMSFPVKFYETDEVLLVANAHNNRIEIPDSDAKRLSIRAGSGDDRISLNGGDMDVFAGTQIDLDGGSGADKLHVIDASDTHDRTHRLTASAYARSDVVIAKLRSINQAEIVAGKGHDRVDASGVWFPVTLRGGLGDDTLIGGNADDLLDGGSGHNVLQQG